MDDYGGIKDDNCSDLTYYDLIAGLEYINGKNLVKTEANWQLKDGYLYRNALLKM